MLSINGILDYFKLNDDEDYDDYDEYEDEVREEPIVRSSRRVEAQEKKAARRTYSSQREQRENVEDEPRRERAARTERPSKVVPMRATTKPLEVHIVKPASFEDSQEVCEILLGGQAVVVNLEGFDEDEAQRIMDFISGCIFAINGKLHRISKYIFIFSPDNVDISGDYLDFVPEDKKNSLTINKGF